MANDEFFKRLNYFTAYFLDREEKLISVLLKHGFTYEAIAKAIGTSRQAIFVRMKIAKERQKGPQLV